MKFDFMGYRHTFLMGSGLLILLSLLLLLGKGLNYGIDFKGGNIIHLRFLEVMDENKIRQVFAQIPNLYFKPEQVVIQAVATGGGKEFILQYPAPAVDEKETSELHSTIMRQLKEKAPYEDESLAISNVGPTLGEEMKWQGIRAAFFSVVGILLYLAWRFEFYSGTGAVLALVHDLIITLGFISLLNVEFDVSVLAAVLTMLGYSVNDTIVVFDRIRENRRLMREQSFIALINESINSTLGRTINTSLTTLFTLFALLLVGGTSIKGFATTLTFGIAIGTYSSIFVASPILLFLTGERLDRKRR
ncbi:MAG: Protein-export membrane protein SecF [Candidatus Ozemobacter sibiricus]|jgi:preprotein translocase subunit SecF|uniref:Protein-export membrane protein SecF n=1 Tax=Candidatus Ozemobacter sibiricus TaxID=2268124 RepID=A0A367ZKS8_9BACT|nr:MAG: Protein-export membrane protein SecF [Candidatus Ozemobacter sibiricus]